MDAVIKEYAQPMMCGQVDPDGPQGLETLKAELDAAGMPDIIAEVNAQYEAWKAAQ